MICRADINVRPYHKGIRRFSPEAVGAQGGVLGDGVVKLHNLKRGGVDLNLQGVKHPKTNLLVRQSRKSLGADALPRLPWATN